LLALAQAEACAPRTVGEPRRPVGVSPAERTNIGFDSSIAVILEA